jgi:hypothetical protein
MRFKVEEVAAELGIPAQVLRDRLRGIGINCATRGRFSLRELLDLQPVIYAQERRAEVEQIRTQCEVALVQQKTLLEGRAQEERAAGRAQGAAEERAWVRERLEMLVGSLVKQIRANQDIGLAQQQRLAGQLHDLPSNLWGRPLEAVMNKGGP